MYCKSFINTLFEWYVYRNNIITVGNFINDSKVKIRYFYILRYERISFNRSYQVSITTYIDGKLNIDYVVRSLKSSKRSSFD